MDKKNIWLKELKETTFVDLSEIKKDERQNWIYLYTKQHPDIKFQHTLIEDKFLLYPVTNILEKVFVFYNNAFTFYLQDGKVEMLISKTIKDEDKKIMKKRLSFKEGEMVVLLPVPKTPHAKFQTLGISELRIEKAVPFTSFQKEAILNGILKKIEEKRNEIGELVKELSSNFLK